MSDALVDLLATDVYGLTTTNGFHAQESDANAESQEALARKANGDLACHNEFDLVTRKPARYQYCGTALTTALGAIATAFGEVVGTGAAATLIQQLDINFGGPGQQAEISIDGHSHTTNNHSATTNAPNTFDVSSLIPSGAGLGVPEVFGGTVVSTNCSPASARLSFSLNHIDKLAASGAHFVGESIECQCDAEMTFEGVCGTRGAVSGTVWKQILVSSGDSASDLDTSSIAAHAYIDAN